MLSCLRLCSKAYYLPIIAACIGMNLPANASTASRPGGTGMTWMRTAETLNNGELVAYDQLGIDTYVILNSNLSDFDIFNNVGFNYGLFDSLELGIQTKWLSNDQHGTSGIRSHMGIIKLNVLGDKSRDNYAVTISAYQTFAEADKTKLIGSGETEKGTEINASYYGDGINMHLTLGSGTGDAKYYDPDVQYYSVDKQYANVGLEFPVSEKYIFGIEAIQEQSDDPYFDKNQIFAFSLQYQPQGQWNFDFGAAFGVPEDRSEPAKSFYAGFVYLFDGKPEKSRYPHATTTYQPKPVAKKRVIPTPQSKEVSKPSFKKEHPVEIKKYVEAPRKKNYRYRVRIKNATGSTATAERVKEFLNKNGYGVESIVSVTRRNNTEIRYLKRYSKEALRLALKIPGNQDLRVMSGLDKGVDFELIIGSDIVRNLR